MAAVVVGSGFAIGDFMAIGADSETLSAAATSDEVAGSGFGALTVGKVSGLWSGSRSPIRLITETARTRFNFFPTMGVYF